MKFYPKYSTLQILMHWLSALSIIIVILLPIFRDTLSAPLGGMGNLFMIHKSFGVVVFLLTIIRIFIILKQGVPTVLLSHQKWQRIGSKSVQGMIYILLLLLPISGYLMGNRVISVFNVFTINPLLLSESVHRLFHTIHLTAAYLIIILVILHIAAALYHHYWAKDNVLKSMLPGKSN